MLQVTLNVRGELLVILTSNLSSETFIVYNQVVVIGEDIVNLQS